MKKTLAIIVSAIIVLSFFGISFANDKKHGKVMFVSGEVTAIDEDANTLTIMGKNGEVVLTTSDKTKFPNGKTLCCFDVGNKLSVKYSEQDGKMMAWKVMTMKEIKKMKKKEHKEKDKD